MRFLTFFLLASSLQPLTSISAPIPCDAQASQMCRPGTCDSTVAAAPEPDLAPIPEFQPPDPSPQPQRSVLTRTVRYPIAGAPFRVVGKTFRVVGKGAKVVVKTVVFPAKVARQLHLNSLERRAQRGNQLAARRLQNAACRQQNRANRRSW